MKRLVTLVMMFGLAGCAAAEEPQPTVSKADVASANGKGDSADLDQMCEDLGRDPGCDPCTVQGWYGDGSCDDFCPVRDSDCGVDAYTLRVTTAPELGASMHLVYQSTKDSFSCTDLVWDMLNPKRVPEQVDDQPERTCAENADQTTTCEFTFPNELGDGCKSVIRHIYLDPSNAAESVDPWASLAFVVDEDLGPDDVEVVECEEIMSGPGGDTPTMMCGNDLLHHTSAGAANVSLVLRN